MVYKVISTYCFKDIYKNSIIVIFLIIILTINYFHLYKNLKVIPQWWFIFLLLKKIKIKLQWNAVEIVDRLVISKETIGLRFK